MTKSGRKKCLSFSPFRRRRQAAKDRRFCIIWINRMVNKQVEKHMAEVHSELHLMHRALREEIWEQLRELVTRLNREQRVTSKWQRIIEKDYKEKTEDEKDDANSLNLETMSLNFSETSSESDSIFILTKPPKYEQRPRESLIVLLDVSSNGDTSDASNDTDTSSQTDNWEPEKSRQISPGVATVADTSQLMKESDEKESSRNPFHANNSFTPEEQRCEETWVRVNGTKEEETLPTERHWKEWMDKQEMRGNHNNIKPVDQQNTKKSGRGRGSTSLITETCDAARHERSGHREKN
ncbi:uncharacterized protein LOC116056542 isoform X2 [Sander lucioperca]|uniref:uncharacterized protein LOC116056542 isoform X2 n=1 Tax=Sander lucioperca TaxID=283035 RepID=UPI00165394E2|nr:uncharacterized protein LOC116056542 isoform X2 [Sander lucioperca]